MRKKLFLLLGFMISFSLLIRAQTAKILLIPLDDRPPCLQFPIKMGHIAAINTVTPPRSLLGRFMQFGKADSIILWLKKQDLTQFDAAIVSLDMLAYGGLVASRVHNTPLSIATQRVEILKILRQKNKTLKIYGSSVIMRLAPTADGKNEAYREKLIRWAEDSPYPEHQNLVEKLEREIPAVALNDYKKARERNFSINLNAIDLVKHNFLDYLILSQDDAKPKGVHVKDRESLIEQIKTHNLGEKIAVQPGADEVSMLLLARAMSDKYQYIPKIKVIYSSDSMAQQAMPFEDRPLSKTVSFHIRATGAREVANKNEADILFYVFTSRFEKGEAVRFAQEMAQNSSKPIILADIDPFDNMVQGGDTAFTEQLLQRGIFSKIYGYACWNTAGNTIGTALPQGIIYGVAQTILSKKVKKKTRAKNAYAQKWFVFNRLFDDLMYHSVVRPKALALIKEKKWNAFHLTNEQTTYIENFCLQALLPLASKIGAATEGVKFSNFTFLLPWNRTFEAEIDFEF